MKKFDVRELVAAGLMAALVVVGTMLIQVPTPTRGYIHIGDSMVYLCGVLLNPLAGFLAAAAGSFLADVFSGYGVYAPVSFVVKGLDALVVGLCYKRVVAVYGDKTIKKAWAFAAGVLLGGSIMVLGYLAYETFLYGFYVAVLGIAGNITQALGGGLLAFPLVLALGKIGERF